MAGVSLIQDLVSDGNITPSQGADLIELRSELEKSRERKVRRSRPVLNALMMAGTFMLVLLGVRGRDA
jgi:hypothetical protein